jgi:hypothetical protein
LNLGEFRTRIARVTGMSLAATGDLALMDGWVNEGVVQFLKETKLHTRLASLSVTSGQEDYILDTDILAMQGLWYEPDGTSNRRLLQAISPEAMFEMRLPQATDTHQVAYYSLSGAHTLMLHPAPNNDLDSLHILYVPRPAAMSTTADTPSATANGAIPEEYHHLIESYAKWKAGSAEEHKASDNGLQFQAEFERGVAKVRSEMARKAGTVMPSVRIGRSDWRRYAPPGVDRGY